MSDKLTVRVLHPHSLDGVMLFPGDELEMDKDRFLRLEAEHPFPYMHVVSGSLEDESGTRMAVPEELPLDDSPESLREPSEVEFGEEVTTAEHPELPLEGELLEEKEESKEDEEASKPKSRKK
jgi:hypothetical protein